MEPLEFKDLQEQQVCRESKAPPEKKVRWVTLVRPALREFKASKVFRDLREFKVNEEIRVRRV